MSFTDQFLGAIGTTTGRAVGYVLVGLIVLGGGYALYRAYGPTPETDPQNVTEVGPGLPPIFDESTIVRPDSAENWIIEEVPGDFDATLTIDLPERDSAEDGQDYVSIGLREGAEQFFPEFPGKRKLPLGAVVIGPYGKENVRIKARPQPIIAFDLQAELGMSAFTSPLQIGGAVGVTGARVFGVRLGGFAAAGPAETGASGVKFRAGPYGSIRVYGPIGVGVGKDIISSPPAQLEGTTFTITTDLPI